MLRHLFSHVFDFIVHRVLVGPSSRGRKIRSNSSGQRFSSRALSEAKAASYVDVAPNQMRKDVLRPSGGEKLYGA